jgi:hypothetical protein
MVRTKFLILFAASVVLSICLIVLSQASDYQNWDYQQTFATPAIPDSPDINPQSVVPPAGLSSENNQVFFYTQPNIINSPITVNSAYSSTGPKDLSAQYLGPALPPVNILEKLEQEERLRRAEEISYPELSAIQSFPEEEDK